MRTAAERSAEPDVLPDDTELVVCDVLKDSQSAAPAALTRCSGPALAEQMLGDGKNVQLFEKGYREIVSLPSALAAYRAFFTAVASEANRPALFHCTTGEDRTGWAAAATLPPLGVSTDDVAYDYQPSNEALPVACPEAALRALSRRGRRPAPARPRAWRRPCNISKRPWTR